MTRLYLCVLPACGLHVGFPEVRAAGTPVGASGDGCPRLPARATTIAHYPDSAIAKRNQLIADAVALFPNLLPEENAS